MVARNRISSQSLCKQNGRPSLVSTGLVSNVGYCGLDNGLNVFQGLGRLFRYLYMLLGYELMLGVRDSQAVLSAPVLRDARQGLVSLFYRLKSVC